MKQTAATNSSGYALLFAILVTSILLSAGLGISNIIYKELLLSAIGKQSAIAFYAADTGAECALYWERNAPSGGSGSPPISAFPSNTNEANALRGRTAYCAERDIIAKFTDDDNFNGKIVSTETLAVTTFSLALESFNSKPCALVRVGKGGGVTLIESRGFNVPCDQTSNVRRVERALRYRIQSTN